MRKEYKSECPTNQEHSLKACPIFLTLSLIANKWSVKILQLLIYTEKNTLRFSQLKHGLGGITQRELTKHLREFEKSGIVIRKVYTEMPLRVEYTLTHLGRSLCTPIRALSQWAEENGALVQQRRSEFEKT